MWTISKKNVFGSMAFFGICLFAACSSNNSEPPCVDYLAVQKSGSSQWTLLSTTGEEILSDRLNGEEVTPSVGGIFSMKDSMGMVHFYTATEEMRPVGGDYLEAGAFTGNLAPVVCKGGWIQYIDKEGNVAFDLKMVDSLGVMEAYNFHYGLARFRSAKGLYGFIDERGQVVIPAKYREAGDFCEGVAVVKGIVENGKLRNGSKYDWAVIDTDGDEVFSCSDAEIRLGDRMYYRDGLLQVSIETTEELTVNGAGTGKSSKMRTNTVLNTAGKELTEYRISEMQVRLLYDGFMVVGGQPMKPNAKRLFDESLDDIEYNGAFGLAKKGGMLFLFKADGKGYEIADLKWGSLFGSDVVGYDKVFFSDGKLRDLEGKPLNDAEYSEIISEYPQKVTCNYVDPEIVSSAVSLKQNGVAGLSFSSTPEDIIHFLNAEDKTDRLAGKQIVTWYNELAKGVRIQYDVAYQEVVVMNGNDGQYVYSNLTPRYFDIAIDFEEIGSDLQATVYESLVKQAKAWSQPFAEDDRWFTARTKDGKLAVSISSLAGGIRLRYGYKVYVDIGDDSPHLNSVAEFEYDMPVDENGNPDLEGWEPMEEFD